MDKNIKSDENKKAIFSSYLQNINLKEIFSEEELNQILIELNSLDDSLFMNFPITIPRKSIKDANGNIENYKKHSFTNAKKVNQLLCDRTKFILNVLKLSCDKLKKNKLNYLAKGVEW